MDAIQIRLKNPKKIVGYIDSVDYHHWGRGFYYPMVYYHFRIDQSIVINEFEGRLEESYSRMFQDGDSVEVVYNSENPKQARIEKLTSRWHKIEHGKRIELESTKEKYISKRTIVFYSISQFEYKTRAKEDGIDEVLSDFQPLFFGV